MVKSVEGPSESAIFPRLRVGRRWLNLLWVIPAVAVGLLLLWLLTAWLRTFPGVSDFIARYPGSVPSHEVQGFPVWMRWQHFLNALFLVPIVRSGLQLLAGRPRFYWSLPGQPGREWLRFQRAYPTEGGWPVRDDGVALPSLVGLPGPRRTGGLARWWHLSIDLLWLLNGVVFYVLLFATGQWVRIVPTSLEVFPQALSATVQYASWDFPTTDSWIAYNGVQQLTYFVTVFVAAPLALVTGLMQSQWIAKRLRVNTTRWAEFGRSVHVLVLGYFIVFVILHVTLVLITGALTNLNHITLGSNDSGWLGAILMAVQVLVIAVVAIVASPLTRRYPSTVEKVGGRVLGPLARYL
jgi:methionine sulfoxide reductase catalytic subunit